MRARGAFSAMIGSCAFIASPIFLISGMLSPAEPRNLSHSVGFSSPSDMTGSRV